MKIEYLTDLKEYLEKFPQFTVVEYDEVPNFISSSYLELFKYSKHLTLNYDLKKLFTKKAIIICDLTSSDDSSFSSKIFNIFSFVADWLNIPVIAFPLFYFNKYSPNNFNATFAKIQKMNEVLDKLNLQKSDEVIVLVSYMKVLEDDVREFLNKLEEYYVNRFTK